MLSTWALLFLFGYLPYIILGDGTNSQSTEFVTSQDDNLGIKGYVLFHDYNFKKSSALASQLISTMMNYNVELGELVRGYARGARGEAPEDESYATKEDECYRRLLEMPWYPKIKPNLIGRLTDILTTLIEKDAKLAERVANCGADNAACVDHVTYRALVEIGSYGQGQLETEMKIKQDYLARIRHEMDRCLYPAQRGEEHQGTK